MAGKPITQFELDDARLDVIRDSTDNYGVGSENAEWPNNILSRRTVVYESGRIARRGDPVRQSVDPNELALCRRLASEAAALMEGVEVGMGSESGDPFRGFFIAADTEESVPDAITEALIRARFGGTIFPPATITVEPLREAGTWWAEVAADSSDGDDEDEEAESAEEVLLPWREMIRWFQDCPDFIDTTFVRIGDRRALWAIDQEKGQVPEGTEITGCVLPRLVLGLTRQGSLVGLFGVTIQT